MIVGIVNAEREAVISIEVRGSNGQRRTILAVIDTGFDGSLTLPFAHCRFNRKSVTNSSALPISILAKAGCDGFSR